MAARRTTVGDEPLGRRLLRALAAGGTHGETTRAALREVAGRLSSPLAILWVVDEQSGLLRWEQDWATGSEARELGQRSRRLSFPAGQGLPGRVLASAAPAWIEDVSDDDNFPRADAARAAGLRSVIAAPLRSVDGVVGVVEFFGSAPRVPAEEELEDVTEASDQLGFYLARLRIEGRLRAVEDWSASIFHAALDSVVAMDHRGRVLDFNPAAESTFGYSRDDVIGRRLADLIIPPDLREAHARALERYVQTREPRILDRRLELVGMRADGSTFPVELSVTRLGTKDPPIFAGFIRDITDRRRSEADQSRLLSEALVARAQAEAAGVRADREREEAERAREEAERSRERLAFLARAGRDMAESMDWETTLRAVVRSAVPRLADWSSLTVVEPGGRLRVVAVGHNDREREKLAWELAERYPPDPDAAHGTAGVIRSGELEVAADIPAELLRATARDAEHRRLLESLEVRHSVIAPLKTPAGVIGALAFLRGPDRRPFSPEDLELITMLAARAGLHIQNARLYTERSHVARTLQASLRPPKLPVIPGAELAARFRPAGAQHEVGGDFYDVFASGDSAWTVVVGDVAGKGAEAAAVTALARHTLRAAAMVHDGPSTSLGLLNRALQADATTARFCTAVYGRLNPHGDGIRFNFSNAGHPAPLLLRRDGRVETVESGRGPLLAGLTGAEFGEATLQLQPGELLLLYTDGVTEVRTTDVQLGERELRATLARHAAASAEEVVAAVESRAVDLQGGVPRDDIALVAIRATGTAAGDAPGPTGAPAGKGASE